ncbi:MAG: RagB/SusD family nutrient uptake outer membrane protein [Bacteroidetes bacterium]|nr:MAG: RagB/SusD family nutrient uptake outer membrane protein [Bacteroidota bacterium]
MKLKYKYGILFFLAVLFNSCSDMLDVDLQGEYTNNTFYKTKEQVLFTLNATYQICSFTSTNNNLWVFGDVASDDAVKGGNSGDLSDITYVNDFNVNSDNGQIESIWKHYYEGIVRANNVIYYVPNIKMDEKLKQRIIGEAKFLRAYFYFNLTNIFGKIPLKTSPINNVKDLSIPVSPIEDIYNQIEQDLIDASTVLPTSYDATNIGRATRGAALGLLSKAYLFQKKWALALENADSVEQLGYSLMPIYSQNFRIPYQNNTESIFEIQQLSGQSPALGSYLNQYFSPKPIGGYAFDAPTQNFVDEFEVTQDSVVDPRLDYTVGRKGEKWVNGENFDPSWSVTGYLNKKHVEPKAETPIIGDGNLDYVYMRFAEILLIKAEALNELNRCAEALIPLNKVRKRARECYLYDTTLVGYNGAIPNKLLPDISNTDQSYLRSAIRHERRVELGFEFHRFFDLMRYGKNVAEQALNNTNFNYEQHRYFPIPQSEIDSNNQIN